ncbi:unnamed protein product [Symbiodinium necroappetens]|uniref:Uncharacterized protein n=1 Tax=Symbiodinium necroappetens TaxID=1628268 RepID=A0A813AKN6_9DINO|nr:unnamed protein product [Symbiodinium sp. CCMP2456]CAE7872411.1 unnamed protein product [Symbiodinium necroappetens]
MTQAACAHRAILRLAGEKRWDHSIARYAHCFYYAWSVLCVSLHYSGHFPLGTCVVIWGIPVLLCTLKVQAVVRVMVKSQNDYPSPTVSKREDDAAFTLGLARLVITSRANSETCAYLGTTTGNWHTYLVVATGSLLLSSIACAIWEQPDADSLTCRCNLLSVGVCCSYMHRSLFLHFTSDRAATRDTVLHSALVGRAVAAFGEMCFASLILTVTAETWTLQAERLLWSTPPANPVVRILTAPWPFAWKLVCLAEILSTIGTAKMVSYYFCIENLIWTILAASVAVLGLSLGDLSMVAVAICFIAYTLVWDIPGYFSRARKAQARASCLPAGAKGFGDFAETHGMHGCVECDDSEMDLLPGLVDCLWRRRVVTTDAYWSRHYPLMVMNYIVAPVLCVTWREWSKPAPGL